MREIVQLDSVSLTKVQTKPKRCYSSAISKFHIDNIITKSDKTSGERTGHRPGC